MMHASKQQGGHIFQLLVTNVAKCHGLIKLFGQTDVRSGEKVRKYLDSLSDSLNSGQSATHLSPGQSVLVRHDGSWYRGKVTTLSGIKVMVNLVDTGQTQVHHLSNIRTDIKSNLQTLPPLAVEFILAEVVPPAGDWSKPSIEFVRDALQGDLVSAQIIHSSHGYQFVRVFKNESREPLVNDMIQCGFAVAGYPNMEAVPPAENFSAAADSSFSPPQMAVMPMVHQRSSGHQVVSPTSSNFAPPISTMAHHDLNYQTHSWSDGVDGVSDAQENSSYSDDHHYQQFHHSGRSITLDTGTWYPITISSVEQGPPYFFIQLESLNDKLDDMMRAINNLKLSQLPRGQIDSGSICLARYSVDQSIYRAIILSRSSNDLVKVQYIDYGNYEHLPRDQIFEMPDMFLAPQMMAVPCKLYQWPTNLSSDMAELAKTKIESLCNKTLNCRVMSLESGGGVFGNLNMIQLYQDSVDLGQELKVWLSRHNTSARVSGGTGLGAVNSQNGSLATSGGGQTQWSRSNQMSNSMSLPAARPTISYSQLELVGTVDVFLSYHGKGPGLFYVQRADTTNQIQQIMREIANLVKTNPLPLTDQGPPRPGAPCLAQYSDGVWYRARVEQAATTLKPGQCRVEFVDFGNSDNVWMNQVYGIPASLVTCLPAQAVPCRLAGNFANLQTDSLVKPLMDLVQDNLFRIKVEKVLNNVCVVQASTTVQPILNINSELTRIVSHLTLSPIMGEVPLVLLITHFQSTNCFYGQRSNNGAEFAIFLANLAEYYSRGGVTLYANNNESHVGEVCGIVNTSNSNFKYYRCKIMREQKSTVDVRIIDVGGSKRVDKSCLMTLPEELQSPPEFGFQCSLGLNTPLVENNLKMNFQDCFVQVQKVCESGDVNIVKITQNSSSNLKNSNILRILKDATPPKMPIFGARPHNQQQHQLHYLPPPHSNNSSQAPQHLSDASSLQQHASAPNNVRQPQSFHSLPPPPAINNNNKDWSRMGNRKDRDEADFDQPPPQQKQQPRREDKKFERTDLRNSLQRGDLRNSLRERRAAREITLSKPITSAYTFPKLHVGMKCRGKISWMFDPTNLYLQLEGDAQAFSHLMEDMQAEFRSGPFDPKQWKRGTPVAAKYSLDDCWYRGKVVGQRDKLVDIYFVDFGNTDKVDDINVLALPQEFGRLPVQAIKCGIADLEDVDIQDKSGLSRYFSDAEYKVQFMKVGNHCVVQLNGGSLAANIIKDINNLGAATGGHKNLGEQRLRKNRKKETSSDTEKSLEIEKEGTPKVISSNLYSYPEINIKEILSSCRTVVVSHCVNWKQFWIQPDSDNITQINHLLKSDHNRRELRQVMAGSLCVAKLDDVWARGVINQIDEDDRASVFFVDIGKTKSIPVKDLETGSKNVNNLAVAAVRCKLDTKVVDLDKVLAQSDNKIRLRFKNYHRGQFLVKLEKEKVEKIGRKEEMGVSVTYLESVSKIWYVPANKLEPLNTMMEQLAAAASKSDLKLAENVEVDQIYGVRYSEDGEMYRAKLINNNNNTLQVHFIDYGNYEMVAENEVMMLPENFKQAEPFAETINIKGAEYALDCTEIKEKLEEFLSNCHVVVKPASGNTKDASLIVDGKPLNVQQWLRYKEPGFNLFRHYGSVRLDCFVTNVLEKKNCVYILESHMLQNLEKMMGELQDKGAGLSKARKLEKGRFVCAKYSADSEIYRAKILNIRDKMAEIHYVDFGNGESLPVKQLLELPKQFILHPPFAMKVSIDNKGECKLLTFEEMQKLVSDGVKLTAELVQPRLSIVRLYLSGQRIGYQSSDQQSSKVREEGRKKKDLLPCARFLSGGSEDIGILMQTSHENSSFIVQNVIRNRKVESRLNYCDLQQADSNCIKVNDIYLYKSTHHLQRVQVTAINASKDILQLKYPDTQLCETLSLDACIASLYNCTATLLRMPVAAVKLSCPDKEFFRLAGKLMLQTFTKQGLHLSQINIQFTNNHNQIIFRGSFPTEMIKYFDLAVHNMNSSQLCKIRNHILEHSIHGEPLQIEAKTHEVVNTDMNDDMPINAKVEATKHVDVDVTNTQTFQPKVETETNRIVFHPDLPSIHMSDCIQFNIISQYLVSVVNTEQTNKLQNVLNEVSHSLLQPFKYTGEQSLAIYTSCPDLIERCVVLDVSDDIARIFLLDVGYIRYCDVDELRAFLPSLCEFAPLRIPVSKIVDNNMTSSADKVLMKGKLVNSSTGLEMQIISDEADTT